MRKRSTQEIIEVVGVYGNPDLLKKKEAEIAAQKKKDQKSKPDLTTAKANKLEAETEFTKTKDAAAKAKEKRAAEAEKRKIRNARVEKQAAKASSKEKLATQVAGKNPKLERITSKDKSVSATGKAAMNTAKSAISLGRKVASIPARMSAQKEKKRLGALQMNRGQAPVGGTTRQKAAYVARPVTKAVTNIRRKTGSGIERFGKKLANEDYIHEAEKDSSKEVKKKTIDVMKGKNAVEVNPKIQAEETMSPAQKRKDTNLKKKYDDSDMKQNMIDQYGKEEGMKVYYATIRKQAMKEAKVDKVKSPIYSLPRTQARNERKFGKKGSLEPQGFFGQKPSEAAELSKKRTDEHKAKRGVKKESVSGLEVQDVSDGLKFREYEFIDVIKNEPMKSPKNNITWTEGVKRDEYGDPVKKDGSYAGKKNEDKNPKDEKITRSEETINELSGDLASKAFKAANKKYQYADNNLTREKAYKQQKKFAVYANKKYKKLNKDRYDLNKIYNKEEAKAPVGLMKLAATVAANNKKRKNALQIQKYIGEDKKMGRQSDEALAAAHKRFSSMDQTSPANSFMTKRIQKEIDRRKKANPKPDVTTEGKGSNPNKRYIGDPIVTSKKSFSKTGKIGIDYYTDDEKKKSEKEKMKDAKDPKKNMSREKATQNMQMIKRMTPEQKYARKMRIKQQQKDKK